MLVKGEQVSTYSSTASLSLQCNSKVFIEGEMRGNCEAKWVYGLSIVGHGSFWLMQKGIKRCSSLLKKYNLSFAWTTMWCHTQAEKRKPFRLLNKTFRLQQHSEHANLSCLKKKMTTRNMNKEQQDFRGETKWVVTTKHFMTRCPRGKANTVWRHDR